MRNTVGVVFTPVRKLRANADIYTDILAAVGRRGKRRTDGREREGERGKRRGKRMKKRVEEKK